jgi:hypothetical protein
LIAVPKLRPFQRIAAHDHESDHHPNGALALNADAE